MGTLSSGGFVSNVTHPQLKESLADVLQMLQGPLGVLRVRIPALRFPA